MSNEINEPEFLDPNTIEVWAAELVQNLQIPKLDTPNFGTLKIQIPIFPPPLLYYLPGQQHLEAQNKHWDSIVHIHCKRESLPPKAPE